MVNRQIDNMAALALVPEHLASYVQAISGMDVHFCGQCPCYVGQEGEAVLVAFPTELADWAKRADATAAQDVVDNAVAAALKLPGVPLNRLTVLAPVRPTVAPQDASEERDAYWALPLPLPQPLPQKVRNMLTSAGRLVRVEQDSGTDSWTDGHRELVRHFCASHSALEDGSVFIFEHLGDWLCQGAGRGGRVDGNTAVFSARDHEGRLLACAVGDFTALDTAFYMFAFREPDCPPGVADLLLFHIAHEASQRGHRRLNLGLGINKGVTFFKTKWGAKEMFPLVTTAWPVARRGWWQRIFA